MPDLLQTPMIYIVYWWIQINAAEIERKSIGDLDLWWAFLVQSGIAVHEL